MEHSSCGLNIVRHVSRESEEKTMLCDIWAEIWAQCFKYETGLMTGSRGDSVQYSTEESLSENAKGESQVLMEQDCKN